jgi:hypothetical protein
MGLLVEILLGIGDFVDSILLFFTRKKIVKKSCGAHCPHDFFHLSEEILAF